MKRWMIVSLLLSLLASCVVVPVGERYHDRDRDNYYRHDYRNNDIKHYG